MMVDTVSRSSTTTFFCDAVTERTSMWQSRNYRNVREEHVHTHSTIGSILCCHGQSGGKWFYSSTAGCNVVYTIVLYCQPRESFSHQRKTDRFYTFSVVKIYCPVDFKRCVFLYYIYRYLVRVLCQKMRYFYIVR